MWTKLPRICRHILFNLSSVFNFCFSLGSDRISLLLTYPAKGRLVSRIPSKVEYGCDLGVSNVSDLANFGIVARGPTLVIKSFEVVTIHTVERAQIGWLDRNSYWMLDQEEFKTKGVGEIERSVAFDCCRSVMLVSGTLIPINGTCKDGSTIRCEERGTKWYIDGRLVTSANPSDEVAVVPMIAHGCPVISAKGSFCVSDVRSIISTDSPTIRRQRK
jgi:hypothetical protein